jgi:hypothetical protein
MNSALVVDTVDVSIHNLKTQLLEKVENEKNQLWTRLDYID